MGKVAKALTAIEVGRLEEPGYHAVGTVPGLYLQVTPGGAKSWVMRVKVGAKRREIGLGPYPAVKLAQAHEKARQTRDQIAAGVDPIERKRALLSEMLAKQALEMTFEQAARGYMEKMSKEWKNEKHGQQWANTLETYAYPTIGRLNVKDIASHHVMKVLTPIWETKTETATRVRSRIEKVLGWAKAEGYRSGENPAAWRGNLMDRLANPSKVKKVKNHPAVLVGEAGAFLRDLRQHQGMGALALEFTMLTAARSGEVRGATWAEIDMVAKVWTVPKERMKAGKEHRVPLSDAAVKLLKGLPRMDGTELVFPAVRGGELSDATMSQLMRRMGYKDAKGRVCVPHGLRSTFRDWAGERTSYQGDVIEAALAHARGDKTEAAYFRSDLFDKRRRLMADWAAFVERVEVSADNVVAMRAGA
ncbi:tyrosine-type recombinase/integrase [Acidovorax temperans]|uniref:tyrosine-type recombinase/integrase n=1 Tax=Acidovorax temperans TaxID=80878 RepID=UPI0035AEA029